MSSLKSHPLWLLGNPVSDWLNYIPFSKYKYKIKLVSRLRKREDQALISISTSKVPSSDYNRLELESTPNWSSHSCKSKSENQFFFKLKRSSFVSIETPCLYKSVVYAHIDHGCRSPILLFFCFILISILYNFISWRHKYQLSIIR